MKRNFAIGTIIALLFFSSCGLKPVVAPEPAVPSGDKLFSDAEALFRIHSYDQALEMYGAYLAQYPRQHLAPDALMRMGAIQMLQEKVAAARGTFDRLIEQYPESPRVLDARIARLDTYYQQGAFAEVIRQGTLILGEFKSPAHLFKLHRLLGDAYLATDFFVAAVESYGRAYTYGEWEDNRALAVPFKTAVAQLNVPDILTLLDQITGPVPRGHLLYRLGKNYADAHDVEKALEQLTAFIDHHPGHEMVPPAKQLLAELAQESAYQRHVIGCLLPLTGRYKTFGHRALRGIELALARYSAEGDRPPIGIIIKDTESSKRKAVSAATELASAQVTAIIGPLITAEDAVMVAQNKGIPIITLNQREGITAVGDYVFRNFITPRMQAETIVSHAVENLGLKTFAILYPDEMYGKKFMNRIWDALLAYDGASVRGVEAYDPALTDFAEPIKKLVGLHYPIPYDLREMDYRFIHIDPSLVLFDPVFSEVLKAFQKRSGVLGGGKPSPTIIFDPEEEDPDDELEPFVDFEAIFIPDSSKSAGLIVPQLAFYDVREVYLFGTNLWHSDTLIEMARDYVQGAILPEGFFAASRAKPVVDFVGHFEESYHQSPGFFEAVAYDSARLLFDIAGKPAVRFRQTVRDEILKLRDYPGVTGLSSCDSTGDIQKQLYLLRIKGKRFVEVKRSPSKIKVRITVDD